MVSIAKQNPNNDERITGSFPFIILRFGGFEHVEFIFIVTAGARAFETALGIAHGTVRVP
jgi:hypothetical protein